MHLVHALEKVHEEKKKKTWYTLGLTLVMHQNFWRTEIIDTVIGM